MNLSFLDLKTCIQALEKNPQNPAIRQEYVDKLAMVHQEVMHEVTGLFNKDFYLNCAYKIFQGGFRTRPDLRREFLPMSEDLVSREGGFKKAVLSDQPAIDEYKKFWYSYKTFSTSFYDMLIVERANTPYVYRHHSFPESVRHFEKTAKYLLEENIDLKPKFSTCDPEILYLIRDTGLLLWIVEPNDVIPEIFQEWIVEIDSIKKDFSDGEIKECLKSLKLSQVFTEKSSALLQKIRALGHMIERKSPTVFSTLMHSIFMRLDSL